jgi:hypothetical protein
MKPSSSRPLMLGAADEDRDGVVTLGEAYRHAYEGTLRASSRTLAGVQHATFRHETHGMADIALTTLAARERALVTFPAGRDYLILKGEAEGNVVAEVGARGAERRVSLRPGRYFVRGRGPDQLLEGTVIVRSAPLQTLDESALERVEYARLVRKGVGDRRRADSIEVGYTLRTPLWSGASACQGLVAGGFDAMGDAPTRTSAAAHVGLTGVATIDLSRELYLAVELDALTTFFFEKTVDETDARAVFSLRGNMLVGKRF